MRKYVLFDLDGTLTDPGIGITNSVAYALNKFGIKIEDKKQLNCFIGPPLSESFIKYFNFSEDKANTAVKFYREYFSEIGIFENRLYDGIDVMLKDLSSNGHKIILATSKPEIFAHKILEHFCISKYFTFVSGSLLNGERVNKKDVIEYALNNVDILNKEHAVMVGDRLHDMIGAKACSLTAIGVTYGYGSRDELINNGADHTVDTVAQLSKLLQTL